MKKFKILFITFLLSSFSPVFAAEIDYFDVKLSSDSAKVGEALDLTITAMDKDNNTVDDYIGTILVFSETDPKAELPSVLKESSYTFTLSDAGTVKFENAVIFNSTGKQDLHVYDLDDDTDSVAGIVEIDISKIDEEVQAEEITITSPESGSTLTSNTIQVAGKTVANHRVIVTANGKEYESISNADGIFEVSVADQKDGDVVLDAKVLNADEETLGESETVNIKISANAPIILGISATPDTGYPGFAFRVELVSEKGLERVELTFNDAITSLSETSEGTYITDLIAPEELGEYSISVSLQNALGVKSESPNATKITVIAEPEEEVELESADESQPTGETETPPDLTITGLKLTKLKTKSVLEWDKLTEADYYNVYMKEGDEMVFVEKVTESRTTVYITGNEIKYNDFLVRAIKEEYKQGVDLEGDLSDAVKIQTGPEKYILLLLIALFCSLLIGTQKIIYRK